MANTTMVQLIVLLIGKSEVYLRVSVIFHFQINQSAVSAFPRIAQFPKRCGELWQSKNISGNIGVKVFEKLAKENAL
jgi:hypothetical protein